MSESITKVWTTRGFYPLHKEGAWTKLMSHAETDAEYVAIKKIYISHTLLPDADWPTGLYVHYRMRDNTVVRGLRDVFMTELGIMMISQRMFDVLQDFDLGQTEIRQMPVYGYDRKTLLPMTYYMVQMLEYHPLVVPEESDAVLNKAPPHRFAPEKPSHKLTLRLPKDHKLDFWRDSQVRNWVFVSDQLKEAMKAAGITGFQLTFRACRMLK